MTDHETLADFLREYSAARRAVATDARVQAGAHPGQVVTGEAPSGDTAEICGLGGSTFDLSTQH